MSKELEELEPTRTNGEGAREFQEEVEALINNDVSQCVEANVPQLAESVSTIFEAKIKDIVLRRFHEWREGKLDTIDQMSEAIEQDCSRAELSSRLESDGACCAAVSHWAVDEVGRDIALHLMEICEHYGVDDADVDQLNVLKAPDVGRACATCADVVASDATSIVSTIVIAFIFPTILTTVGSLVCVLSTTIALLLCDLLPLMPEPGWKHLSALVGVALPRALRNGSDDASDKVKDRLMGTVLPLWVRGLIKDDVIASVIDEQGVRERVRAGIMKREMTEKLSWSISYSLSDRIEACADKVKGRMG